jgi:hypothetical protein
LGIFRSSRIDDRVARRAFLELAAMIEVVERLLAVRRHHHLVGQVVFGQRGERHFNVQGTVLGDENDGKRGTHEERQSVR